MAESRCLNTLPDDESLPHVLELVKADSAGQTEHHRTVRNDGHFLFCVVFQFKLIQLDIVVILAYLKESFGQ